MVAEQLMGSHEKLLEEPQVDTGVEDSGEVKSRPGQENQETSFTRT